MDRRGGRAGAVTAVRDPGRLDAGILSRANGVEAEILQEKAAALHRIGARLEAALAALAAFDRGPGPRDAEARGRLVATAAEALWYLVVQREVCGLGGTEDLLDDLSVPREVRLRMGVRVPRPDR